MRFVIASVLAAALAAGGATLAQVSMAQVSGAPMVSRAYTVEPFTPSAPITIKGDGVRLRAEPFASRETQVLSSGSTGLALNVVGIARQTDWNWYQVVLRNGQKAFIRSDLTSAPSRGGATPPSVTAPVQPVQPPPQVVYTPPQTPQPVQPLPTQPQLPVQPSPPQIQPQPVQPLPQPQPVQPTQPLPTIPTQPLNNSGAISLTPTGSAPAIPSAATTPAPVNNGLISVSPSAPAPRFPTQPAPIASTPAPAITTPAPATNASLSVAEQIRAQLTTNRCWTDSSSMMDAHRLRATFAVAFAPDGKLLAEPRLVEPAAEPSNDPAMMVFLAKARAAMRTCNALGFSVPQAYYTGGAGELRLDFSAR